MGGLIAVDADPLLSGASAVGEDVFFVQGEGLLPLLLQHRGVSAEDAVGSGIDVDEVDLARFKGQGTHEVAQAAFEDRREKRIVEVEDQRAGRVVDGGGIAVVDFEVAALLPGGAKTGDVGCGNRVELWGEFHADDAAKWEARGEEKSAAFPGAQVEEGEALVVDVESVNEVGEEAGRDAVVGGAPAVVAMAGGEILAVDKTAGVGAVGFVERMDYRGERLGTFLEDRPAKFAEVAVYEGVEGSANDRAVHTMAAAFLSCSSDYWSFFVRKEETEDGSVGDGVGGTAEGEAALVTVDDAGGDPEA